MNNKKTSGGFDPGAMKFGNFINYYQFHSPAERIKLLSEQIWQSLELEHENDTVVCLDVGCNCGDLTESLHKILQSHMTETPGATGSSQTVNTKQVKMLGIDIDGTLIHRANEKYGNNKDIEYKCLDIMEPYAIEYLKEYLIKTSDTEDRRTEDFQSLNMSGHIKSEITEPTKDSGTEVTHIVNQVNVNKSESQLTNRLSEELNVSSTVQELNRCEALLTHRGAVKKFSILFCFSVTMWIHLNHGDAGLFEFLQKIVTLGKYLVLENQPWKCYRNAQRRIVKSSIKEKRNATARGVQYRCVENAAQTEVGGRKCDDSLVVNENGDLTQSSGTKECEKHKEFIENHGRQRRREKKETEDVGFKHYKELKLRRDVEKDIDAYLRVKCHARKLYESEENEWGRVITVYETK